MTITLTASYKDSLKPRTVALIEELLEDNYELQDMLEFIDEHDEEEFQVYYTDYVEQGEKVGYNIVDAFVEEFGMDQILFCEDAFIGSFESGAHFAEEYTDGYVNAIPDWVVIDWQATWEESMSDGYTAVDNERGGVYVFTNNY